MTCNIIFSEDSILDLDFVIHKVRSFLTPLEFIEKYEGLNRYIYNYLDSKWIPQAIKLNLLLKDTKCTTREAKINCLLYYKLPILISFNKCNHVLKSRDRTIPDVRICDNDCIPPLTFCNYHKKNNKGDEEVILTKKDIIENNKNTFVTRTNALKKYLLTNEELEELEEQKYYHKLYRKYCTLFKRKEVFILSSLKYDGITTLQKIIQRKKEKREQKKQDKIEIQKMRKKELYEALKKYKCENLMSINVNKIISEFCTDNYIKQKKYTLNNMVKLVCRKYYLYKYCNFEKCLNIIQEEDFKDSLIEGYTNEQYKEIYEDYYEEYIYEHQTIGLYSKQKQKEYNKYTYEKAEKLALEKYNKYGINEDYPTLNQMPWMNPKT